MPQDIAGIPDIRFDLRDQPPLAPAEPQAFPNFTLPRVVDPDAQFRLTLPEANCQERTERNLVLNNRLREIAGVREVNRVLSRVCPNANGRNFDLLPEDNMQLGPSGLGVLRFRMQTNGPN